MADTLSPSQRSVRMRRIAAGNTKPELAVRRLLHSMGYRFRLFAKELPGKPDLVFRPRRKAIFVHGCFWHRHPDPTCKLARMPKSRLDFWGPKLTANRERDIRHQSELDALGWAYLIVWECELRHREQVQTKLL